MEQEQRPKVGIGVMIFKDGKVLCGKRKSLFGQGEYAMPGGHLEIMESFENCAKRETREETGVEIENVKFLCLVNFKAYAPRHYAHIWMTADWKSGEPKTMEPEKCEGWDWYELDKLPEPQFRTTSIGLEALKTGKVFFDN